MVCVTSIVLVTVVYFQHGGIERHTVGPVL